MQSIIIHDFSMKWAFSEDSHQFTEKKSFIFGLAMSSGAAVDGLWLRVEGPPYACPYWRKFINRLALAALAHCNDNVNDDGNLRIGHSEKILLRFLVATLCGDDTLTSS